MSLRRNGAPLSTLDAVVVGAGPNGLAAAIALGRAGRSVRLLEGADAPGGGARSSEATLPGFVHDTCSAIHPLGRDSPEEALGLCAADRIPVVASRIRYVAMQR